MPTGSVRNQGQLYYADNHWCDQVKKTRQKLAGICGQCLNRKVRVQTIDGHTYEGVVVGHDNTYLHLANTDARFFGPAAITTLVLFELLVITLLI
ncbi:hypothetical protein [Cohnella yongneupensis]|uniref:DUF2642 domain-containing protein n=1 Tax=Cohnella yongneupensis TaxID=425006 RepID=A0ABW0R1H0_9BACL